MSGGGGGGTGKPGGLRGKGPAAGKTAYQKIREKAQYFKELAAKIKSEQDYLDFVREVRAVEKLSPDAKKEFIRRYGWSAEAGKVVKRKRSLFSIHSKLAAKQPTGMKRKRATAPRKTRTGILTSRTPEIMPAAAKRAIERRRARKSGGGA